MYTFQFNVKFHSSLLSFSLSLAPTFPPVPILFLSLWLSNCSEESAQSLLKELDGTLGDRSDNEMVGGRKTHFLTCERDILMWQLKIALNSI